MEIFGDKDKPIVLVNRIKELRKSKNITQEALCRILNIAQPTLSGYETNSYEPDFSTASKIADYFDVTLDYLVGRADELCERYPLRDVQPPFGNMENLTRNDLDEILKFIDYIKNRKII